MRGCLISLLSLFVAIGVGMGIAFVVGAVGVEDEAASRIGCGMGVFAFLTIATYSSLWFGDPAGFAQPPTPTTTAGIWRAHKEEGKLQTAALRMGFVYALFGGMTSGAVTESSLVLVIVVVCCGALGGWIGFDFKRRVLKIRERELQRKF